MTKEESTINTRIEEIITYSGLTINGFAKKIGVLQQTLLNYVHGRSPSVEVLQKIITTFVDIDAEWLLTGNEPMLKNDKKKTELKEKIDQGLLDQSAIIQFLKEKDKKIEELSRKIGRLEAQNEFLRK
jgi:transcriptional regulator with XRE-family HTH domain